MINVKWLLDEEGPSTMQLSQALQTLGIEFQTVTLLEIIKDINAIGFRRDDCVVYHGNLPFINKLQHSTSWIPGAWCSMNHYSYSVFAAHLGKYLLNSKLFWVPFAELIRNAAFYYDLAEEYKLFIRSDAGDKKFSGQVVRKEDIYSLAIKLRLNLAELLVVAPTILNIQEEWRFLVVNKQIVSGTQYAGTPNLELLPAAHKFAQRVISDTLWAPDPVFTIDVARYIKKAGRLDFGVVEVNSFSAAGLYDLNLLDIIPVINQAALQEYQENM